MRMEVLTYLKVVSRKGCNFVADLYPTIALRPSLNTFYL